MPIKSKHYKSNGNNCVFVSPGVIVIKRGFLFVIFKYIAYKVAASNVHASHYMLIIDQNMFVIIKKRV